MRRLLAAGLLFWASAPVRADIVCDWIELAGRSVDGRPVSPPLQDQVSRTAPAAAALAIFESANRIDPRYRSHLGLAPVAGTASGEAAVAAAAHAVLVALRPDQRVALDEALTLSLSGIAEGPARAAGVAVGEETAKAVLARTLFGGPEAEPYRPLDQPGRYAPPMAPVITQWSMRAQPFFLKSIDEVMPPPPPPLTSERYARDFNETRRIGGRGQPGATREGLIVARYMGGFTLDGMVHRIVDAKPRLVDRARFWALVRMTQHDANAMTAFAKMRYMTWRPFNAIRNADRDDNPATERDPNWEPVLPTPNHPEYPCGHCVASGTIAGLLSPETPGPVSVGSESVTYAAGLNYPDWPSFLAAASLARIQGGMHFRFANEAGQAMGARIAALARERFAPPLKAAR